MFESFSRNHMIIFLMDKQEQFKKKLKTMAKASVNQPPDFKMMRLIHSDKFQVAGGYKQNSFDVNTFALFRPELQNMYMKSSKCGYGKVIVGTNLVETILVVLNSGVVLIDPTTVGLDWLNFRTSRQDTFTFGER